MALNHWIAFIILLICVLYGYAAYFTMDAILLPIMQRSPIWPSSFPKVLAVGGILLLLAALFGLEASAKQDQPDEIPFARILDYSLGQALLLLALMVAYATLI